MKKFLHMNAIHYVYTTIAILLLATLAYTALAHRVVIFAWLEGDTVYTESQFPDGRKIPDAPVKVFDSQNKLLVEGTTDNNGKYSFKIPAVTDLHIVLEAGMGHQGEWNLSEDEIRSSLDITEDKPAAEKTGTVTDSKEASLPRKETSSPAVVVIDEKQLEQIVERVMDKKLQPIARTLAHMQDTGPSVSDIFGGIGYIFGLMGVAAYILSRKEE